VGLIGWVDKNADGIVQYAPGDAFSGIPSYDDARGPLGERRVTNPVTETGNEVYVDRDIMVLANPEIAQLPGWVVALVAAGGVAAALSTAAGLLLVISASVSHDLIKNTFARSISERQELRYARLAAATAVGVAGYLGINPPGFVAQVVAFAFGLAAASLFPAIVMGIFSKTMNREGAIAGMVVGLTFTFGYIFYFKFVGAEWNTAEYWWFGISPEGIGAVGALLNFATAWMVSRWTAPVPPEIPVLVEQIRVPRGAAPPTAH
jgi:cation/acetate symporter